METQATVVKAFAPLTENDLTAKIGQIRKRSNSLMLDIKTAAMNAVYQSVEHGRTNYASDLVAAVPKYMQRQLLNFLQQYGRIQQVKDETTKTKVLKYNKDRTDMPKPEEGKADEYVAGIQKSWTEVKTVREKKAVTVLNPVLQSDKFLAGLHRQVEAVVAEKNAGHEVQEIHTEFIKDFEIFLGKWKVEHGITSLEVEGEEDDEEKIKSQAVQIAKLERQLAKLQGKQEPVDADITSETKHAIEGKPHRSREVRKAA